MGRSRSLAKLASLAERSGWDGVFLEDYVFTSGGIEAYDPWVALAAIALATERVLIGPMVTPLPRRRPWKVAAEGMTIDHLSGGRLVLGVGSGDPESPDLQATGELPDARGRADQLDEALDIIDGLWSGRRSDITGRRFQLESVTLRPGRCSRPRPSIWTAVSDALGRGARERALRWDSWHVPVAASSHATGTT